MSKIWSQSIARRTLLGQESQNPSIAAKSILERGFGRQLVRRAIARAKKRRRPFHRGNPVPALLGAVGLNPLSFLGGLSGRFRKPSEKRAAAVAPQIVQAANAGNLTAARGLIDRAAHPMLPKEQAVWVAALAQVAPAILTAVQRNLASIPKASQRNPEEFAASVMANPVQAGAAAQGGGAAANFGQLLTPGLVTGVVRAATKQPRRRAARGRYPTYVDRQGRQRYSTKPPGTELRIPAGATPTPGTPYNFFRGAVGRGGAAATAGQLALAAGAGIGAYLVTQRLLQHLGGRAQKKEEAGVAATLALRQARADFEAQQGRKPTAAESREMSAAWKAQLIELGYNPVTFTRQRSGVETFLETYNPFD